MCADWNPCLVPETPVGLQDDGLFRSHEEFYGRLTFLADHITTSVLSPEPSPAAVFGISAPWGSGKSSALHVLLDLVFTRLQGKREEVRRDAHGFHIHETYVLTVSKYNAHLHEASGESARTGLVYDILESFPLGYRQQLLEDLEFKDAQVGYARPVNAERFLHERLGDLISVGPSLERWVLNSFVQYRESLRGGVPEGEPSHVHLELIDDLDRCSESYTGAMLAALNFWTSMPGIFFVVAADEEHLRRSARAATEREEKYPGESLEKFVHFQLRLPPLLKGYPDTARYCAGLVPDGSLPEGVLHLRQLLERAPSDGPYGLLAPALMAATPRQAKRSFNELLQEFSILRDRHGDSVKRIVARLVWPKEFEQYIHPAISKVNASWALSDRASPRMEWLRLLLVAARDVLEERDNDPSVSTKRLQELVEERGISLKGCPADLLLYLAAEPPLDLPDAPISTVPTQTLFRELTRPGKEEESRGKEGDRFGELANQASISNALNKAEEVIGAAQRMVSLGQTQNPSRQDAPEIGNTAIIVEKFDLELAWQLHQMALAANSGHANIRMNIAEFLLDHGSPQAASLAEAHLRWLEEHASDFQVKRRKVLRARLSVKQGEEPPGLDDLARIASEEESSDSIRLQIIEVLSSVKRYDLLEGVVKSWMEAEYLKPNQGQAPVVLRLLADSLALADEEEIESRGADLLRYMLSVGYATDDEFVADMANNLAVLLKRYEHADAAGILWRIAYEIRPQNPRLRSTYSSFLLRKQDPHNAQAVQSGQELRIEVPSEERVSSALSELPEHFSRGPWWWENYKPANPHSLIDCLHSLRGEQNE